MPLAANHKERSYECVSSLKDTRREFLSFRPNREIKCVIVSFFVFSIELLYYKEMYIYIDIYIEIINFLHLKQFFNLKRKIKCNVSQLYLNKLNLFINIYILKYVLTYVV